ARAEFPPRSPRYPGESPARSITIADEGLHSANGECPRRVV
ncbi:MAG: hypothetical protein AVDCRST_MAG18-3266, partial [uncultured Thermomicrobiales bacterium]